ncbi:glutathione S-transferase family protein [Aquicoccus porphyridii]|uniref:glutathione S-transferase family protein n=1 Tax=Aquicoccus porphyridii TaxID=1852029 RepID=UPI00273EBB9A|nr:glutathione S-transferase family protein [Aquicoccus porphyridii]
MRLYFTPNSPYARITRVALRESGLRTRVEEIGVATRDPATALFEVTPLARVPVLEDGSVVLADTRDICAHFDLLENRARWFPQEDDATRFLRHVVSGFLDGVAVWLREKARPDGERSDPVMRYEEHRAVRVLRWRDEGRWDYCALVLACALDIAQRRGMAKGWHEIAPELVAWATTRAGDPFMVETAPGG